MWRIGVVVLVSASCIKTTSLECEPGTQNQRLCPSGNACDDVHHSCVLPDQLTSCQGLADGTDCTVGSSTPGLCRDQVCLVAGCGDGIRRGDEKCDGADLGSAADCRDLGFYEKSPLACNSACGYDTSMCLGFCGDGRVSPGFELCDGAPPSQSCVDLGYGAGFLNCSLCGPGLTDCKFFGWDAPHPTATSSEDVHGTDDSNVYVVGTSDLDHFDGVSWSHVDLTSCIPAGTMLSAVFTFGTGDVIAVALNGIAARLTTAGCTSMIVDPANGALLGVWANAPDDIFATGTGGVFHFDGQTWTRQLAVPVNGVWGVGHDVYTFGLWYGGGDPTTLWHYSGSTWTQMTGFTIDQIRALWGTSPTDIYIGGGISSSSAVIKYNGSTWTPIMTGVNDIVTAGAVSHGRVLAAAGTSDQDDIWAYDGTTWSQLGGEFTQQDKRMWVSPSGKIFAFERGLQYGVARYEGQVLRTDPIGHEVLQITVRNANEAHIVLLNSTTDTIADWNGLAIPVGWTIDTAAGVPTQANDVWVDAAGTIYVPQQTGPVRKRVGTTWSNATGATAVPGTRIWGTSGSDFWVAQLQAFPSSGSYLLHWNGASVDTLCATCTTPQSVMKLWGASSTNIFAVEFDGTIVHWNGSAWASMTVPAVPHLFAIAGSSATNVVAVGYQGGVLRYDGTTWHDISIGIPVDMYAVYAAGPNDIFVGGRTGYLYHYDGTHWAPVRSGTIGDIYGIGGAGDTIFIVDQMGGGHRLIRTIDW